MAEEHGAATVDPECASLQHEEWEVIESIYPDYISQSLDADGSFRLELPVEFGQARTIHIMNDSITDEAEKMALEAAQKAFQEEKGLHSTSSLSLTTLPPLLLHIILPSAYPIRKAPSLLSIRATHLWLQTRQITR
ncbi:hypothetical protein V5O48_008772, partial [Marasmius crinis-equi]